MYLLNMSFVTSLSDDNSSFTQPSFYSFLFLLKWKLCDSQAFLYNSSLLFISSIDSSATTISCAKKHIFEALDPGYVGYECANQGKDPRVQI